MATWNSSSSDLLQLINPNVEITMVENTPDDPRQRKPDITKATELLGWEPKIKLRDGLPLMEDDFRLRLAVPRKNWTELNWTELHYLYTRKSCREAYKSANLSLISSIFAPLCYGINGFVFCKSCMVIHIWKIEWYFVSYIRKKRFAVFQRSSPQMLHLPIFLSIQLSIQS